MTFIREYYFSKVRDLDETNTSTLQQRTRIPSIIMSQEIMATFPEFLDYVSREILNILTVCTKNGPTEMPELSQACAEGRLDDARRRVAQGASILEKGEEGQTALHAAAAAGHAKVVDWLLGATADPQASFFSFPPLFFHLFFRAHVLEEENFTRALP